MKTLRIPLFSAFLCFISWHISAQTITVNDTFNAQQLVENVLINSPCANVSNFSVSGWTFDNGNVSYGYFTNGNSNFPFTDGVIITTGRAVSAIGPNTSLLSEGPAVWGGDPDLAAAIGENNTINATVLEFDFLPLANKISFEYIFSSEQYLSNPNPNQCNFSDGFAFLLREANTTQPFQNLAVVPGTNIPVKITTVRGSGTICPPANEPFFDAFNGTQHPTNYNGQTKILKAEAAVTPGVLYKMKLVVADQGNQLYDSAIFLGGGSFKLEVDLGEDRLVATENPLCPNETIVLDATQVGNGNTYQWFRNGEALLGNTAPTLAVTTPGTYEVFVTLGSGGCTAEGSVTIELGTPLSLSPVTLEVCPDSNGLGVFNLSNAENQMLPQGANVLNISYFNTLIDAQQNQSFIQNTSNFVSTETTIYARVVNNLGCAAITEIQLRFSTQQIDAVTVTLCDDDSVQDGITNINLTQTVSPIITQGLPTTVSVVYYATLQNALSQTSALPNIYTNSSAFQETVYARFQNGVNCVAIQEINLIISAISNPVVIPPTTVLCLGSTLTLLAQPNFTYLWSNGATTRGININQPGNYTVTVTNANGCTVSYTFEIEASEAATIQEITIRDFQSNRNQIEVIATGIGNYTYSLDGISYQESAIFTGLNSCQYTVYVRDSFCGVVTQNVFVADFPKFFTPNGDGFNDFWHISGLNANALIIIYDRYGKYIYAFKGNGIGWDGNFNGRPLPASDYWFTIQRPNQPEIKGHFSLVR